MPDQLIEIYPTIPASLARLPELARNLFFSWHRPTRALFEDLEPELWQQVGGNLLLMLRCINQENLDRAAGDRIYLERYRQVVESFDAKTGDYKLRPAASAPLVRHFLTHTSGLAYPFTSAIWRDFKPHAGETYPFGGPLLFDPGERWHYSTSIDVVGRLVEVASGQKL